MNAFEYTLNTLLKDNELISRYIELGEDDEFKINLVKL